MELTLAPSTPHQMTSGFPLQTAGAPNLGGPAPMMNTQAPSTAFPSPTDVGGMGNAAMGVRPIHPGGNFAPPATAPLGSVGLGGGFGGGPGLGGGAGGGPGPGFDGWGNPVHPVSNQHIPHHPYGPYGARPDSYLYRWPPVGSVGGGAGAPLQTVPQISPQTSAVMGRAGVIGAIEATHSVLPVAPAVPPPMPPAIQTAPPPPPASKIIDTPDIMPEPTPSTRASDVRYYQSRFASQPRGAPATDSFQQLQTDVAHSVYSTSRAGDLDTPQMTPYGREQTSSPFLSAQASAND